MSGPTPSTSIAAAAARLAESRARLTQAEQELESASGPEKAQAFHAAQHWAGEAAAALAIWRSLAGPDASEPG